ncbi:MAG: SdpI family protein [Armatimonadota bacterium]|nr:SdpI family protein [Armatimonadota bacterium]
MKFTFRNEALSLTLLFTMFVLAFATWPIAPERIPVHWDFQGLPDRYGGKVEGLLAIPLLALGIYILMVVLPRFDPRFGHYFLFAEVYRLIRTSLVAILFGVYLTLILWVRGYSIKTELVVPILVGLLFLLLGNYLGKIRSTWFVGIRTPWTLSSEESWNKTHRLGGKLFILLGIGWILLAFVKSPWLLAGVLALLLGGILFLTAYSYLIWRQDPYRQQIPPEGSR